MASRVSITGVTASRSSLLISIDLYKSFSFGDRLCCSVLGLVVAVSPNAFSFEAIDMEGLFCRVAFSVAGEDGDGVVVVGMGKGEGECDILVTDRG